MSLFDPTTTFLQESCRDLHSTDLRTVQRRSLYSIVHLGRFGLVAFVVLTMGHPCQALPGGGGHVIACCSTSFTKRDADAFAFPLLALPRRHTQTYSQA